MSGPEENEWNGRSRNKCRRQEGEIQLPPGYTTKARRKKLKWSPSGSPNQFNHRAEGATVVKTFAYHWENKHLKLALALAPLPPTRRATGWGSSTSRPKAADRTFSTRRLGNNERTNRKRRAIEQPKKKHKHSAGKGKEFHFLLRPGRKQGRGCSTSAEQVEDDSSQFLTGSFRSFSKSISSFPNSTIAQLLNGTC